MGRGNLGTLVPSPQVTCLARLLTTALQAVIRRRIVLTISRLFVNRIIWQYWETRGQKPAFIDGLLEIAIKNAGVKIILVTPETLPQYLPECPPEVHAIQKMAHKADMIRAMLIKKHGGMWLDSDAIVLKDLNWLFDLLSEHEFIGFDDAGGARVRVNCFLSRPNGTIISEWVRLQHAKFPRTEYEWEEIGSDILDPLCKTYQAKILPFHLICPIAWYEVEEFERCGHHPKKVVQWLNECMMVMMTNNALSKRNSEIIGKTVPQLAAGNTLISHFIRKALDNRYAPSQAALYGQYVLSYDANMKRLRELRARVKKRCARTHPLDMEYNKTGGL